jgi:hypothetical protein
LGAIAKMERSNRKMTEEFETVIDVPIIEAYESISAAGRNVSADMPAVIIVSAGRPIGLVRASDLQSLEAHDKSIQALIAGQPVVLFEILDSEAETVLRATQIGGETILGDPNLPGMVIIDSDMKVRGLLPREIIEQVSLSLKAKVLRAGVPGLEGLLSQILAIRTPGITPTEVKKYKCPKGDYDIIVRMVRSGLECPNHKIPLVVEKG